MNQSDNEGRDAPGPYGQGSAGQPYGQQYGQPQPEAQQQYGSPAVPPTGWGTSRPHAPGQGDQYGQQPAYGPPPGGYPQQYGTPYGQQPGQAPYGQPYGQYGGTGLPARPGGVTAAAVFGFIFGALGVLVTIILLFTGAVVAGDPEGAETYFPGFDATFAGLAAGIIFVAAVLALAWTVLTIWGSVQALRGRSRVMLLVTGSIAIVGTGLAVIGAFGDEEPTAGGILLALALLAMSVAIVVLLARKPAAAFYAAHRARRGG